MQFYRKILRVNVDRTLKKTPIFFCKLIRIGIFFSYMFQIVFRLTELVLLNCVGAAL